MATKAWSMVTPTTIRNCFRKGGFSVPTVTDTPQHDDDVPVPPTLTDTQFDDYVTHDDDLDCYGVPTDSDIVADFLSEEPTFRATDASSDEEDDTDDDPYEEKMTFRLAQQQIRKIRSLIEDNGGTSFTHLYGLQDQLRTLAPSAARQTKVTEFINWIP